MFKHALKIFLFISILHLSISYGYAYELILPQEKQNKTSSNYALFLGKTQNSEIITINNEHILPASNGAFAHSVKLKEGENRIIIRSNFNTQVYKFYKKTYPRKHKENLVCFDKYSVTVNNDNTPLRNTPIDEGVNRISHLFKGTTLLIDGEQGSFYRVLLSKGIYAWIAKKDVTRTNSNIEPATFLTMNSQKYKNANVQTIAFSKNIPYAIEVKEKEILFRVYNPEFSENSVYTLNIPKPEKYYYSIKLIDGVYTFKVSELTDELQECNIVIDAGHGGSEKGAIGCLGDLEKDLNLKIALSLQKKLKDAGANVIMTRECDGDISLNDRVSIAKNNQADIFISIHNNSIGDVPFSQFKHKGTSVYYFNPHAQELASILEKNITKTAGTRKDGVKAASFAVIRPTDYIGVLIEASYMINPYDSILYKTSCFADNVANGIVNGIIEYLEK